VEMMIGRRPGIIFRIALGFITPAVIFAMIVFTGIQYTSTTLFNGMDYYTFPAWSEAIGWIIVTFCLFTIPGVIIYQIVKASMEKKFSLRLIVDLTKPTAEWGPADKKNWTGRYAAALHPAGEFAEKPTVWSVSQETGMSNAAFQADDVNDTANNNVDKSDIEAENM